VYLSPCIDKRLQYLQMIKVVWNVVKKIFGFVMLIFSPLKRLWCRRKRRTSDPILPISNHYPSVENLNVSYSSMNGTGQVLYLLSTQRGFYKVPLTPRFSWAYSPLNAVRWSRGKNTVDCRSFGWQEISKKKYLRTNNATKWQINQTTVDPNVHFTMDALMYMYVNNLTGPCFSIYNVCKCEVERITFVFRLKFIFKQICLDRRAYTSRSGYCFVHMKPLATKAENYISLYCL